MKNNNLRNLALLCLVFISLSCYIFLNTTKVEDLNLSEKTIEHLDTSQNPEKEVMLPDVKVIKAIIEKGKHLLPAS